MHNRPLYLSKMFAAASAICFMSSIGTAFAHYPKVFSYKVINKTEQDLWLYQPLNWLSCGIGVQANQVIIKLPRNGGRVTRNVFQSEKGFFGRCPNQQLSVKFALIAGPKPTSTILAIGNVYSTAPSPYGAMYKVVCDKLTFSKPAFRVPYNVEHMGEETNFCQYALGVPPKPDQAPPPPTNAGDSN